MTDYIAIGDIHGMRSLLDELLVQLPDEGELVFLGDYIDRGPDSRGVIDRLLQLSDSRPCHFLRGNHEAILLAALDSEKGMEQFWLRNGGLATVESYQGRPTPEHEQFFRRTRPYLVTEDYLFVHAGLLPGKTLAESDLDELLWVHDPFLTSEYDWGKLVIHGHTPTENRQPDLRANRINIDTGAVYGGALTAMLLPERECISVPCRASCDDRRPGH